MLRDDFSMLRKMFNEPNVPIDIDIWLEEGNLIDLGNFRLNVMYTPGHTSACITLFDQDKGLLFAADTLMPGGVMGGVFGSGSDRRLHPVAGTAEGPQRRRSCCRVTAGCPTRRMDDVRIAIATVARPARGHRAAVRRAWMRGRISSRSCRSVRDLNKLDD